MAIRFFTMMAALLLAGCVAVPVGHGPHDGFCPPGQAKKGHCAAGGDPGVCPPGQAKKGNC